MHCGACVRERRATLVSDDVCLGLDDARDRDGTVELPDDQFSEQRPRQPDRVGRQFDAGERARPGGATRVKRRSAG